MGIFSIIGETPDENGCFYAEVLRFNSNRAKRVAHSTLSAETLAGTGGLEQNVGTRMRFAEFETVVDGVLHRRLQSQASTTIHRAFLS